MPEQSKYTLNPNNWVDTHADYLLNYAITRINNKELAKDIVQETFFSGLKAQVNFRGQTSERTWLISILKHKIIDHYSKINSKKVNAEIKVNFYKEGEKKGNWLEECAPKTWDNEAEKDIGNKELKNVLAICIENLPEKSKVVFLMKNVQKYETEQICSQLGITAPNFWIIIHRVRHKLRICLEELWFAK